MLVQAQYGRRNLGELEWNVHPVQLGARRGDLLDAELAQLSLELSELLDELVLALGPQGTGLNLGGGLDGVLARQFVLVVSWDTKSQRPVRQSSSSSDRNTASVAVVIISWSSRDYLVVAVVCLVKPNESQIRPIAAVHQRRTMSILKGYSLQLQMTVDGEAENLFNASPQSKQFDKSGLRSPKWQKKLRLRRENRQMNSSQFRRRMAQTCTERLGRPP